MIMCVRSKIANTYHKNNIYDIVYCMYIIPHVYIFVFIYIELL